jgi:hypothetical protein
MTGTHRGCRRTLISRRSTIGVLGTAAALVTLGLMSPQSSVASANTAGTWSSGPDQTYTDSTTTAPGDTAYKTSVRPPINADGSSNFPAKRGVIPVQFDLLAAPSTITTTTRTYDPPVWESIGSDSDTGNDFSFASFAPTTPIPLADLTHLSADYVFTTGNCHGGSLRWSVSLDWTGDGVRDGGAFVYYGDGPNFTDCTTTSQSGTNMRSLTDLRVDTSPAGGTFYDSWSGLISLHPNATVTRASLVLDSGWGGDQRADVSNVTVNDNTWVPKTSEVIDTSTTTGDFAKTCALPDAKLQWAKGDSTPTGAVNEAESIQPKDTGIYYRQVDCKYLYSLAVSNLSGQGTYYVWANIEGTNVSVPAKFDLR